MSRATITLSGKTLDRARLEQLLADDLLLSFDDCDFSQADLGGLKRVNAKLFAGAAISPRQVAELVRAMGLKVA